MFIIEIQLLNWKETERTQWKSNSRRIQHPPRRCRWRHRNRGGRRTLRPGARRSSSGTRATPAQRGRGTAARSRRSTTGSACWASPWQCRRASPPRPPRRPCSTSRRAPPLASSTSSRRGAPRAHGPQSPGRRRSGRGGRGGARGQGDGPRRHRVAGEGAARGAEGRRLAMTWWLMARERNAWLKVETTKRKRVIQRVFLFLLFKYFSWPWIFYDYAIGLVVQKINLFDMFMFLCLRGSLDTS